MMLADGTVLPFSVLPCHRQQRLWWLRLKTLLTGLFFPFSLLRHRHQRLRRLRLVMLLTGLSFHFSLLLSHRQLRLWRLRLTTLPIGLSFPSPCCRVIYSCGCGGCA